LIADVRQAIADVLRAAIPAVVHVNAYQPTPVVRPSIWVDRCTIDAEGGPGSTMSAPYMSVEVLIVADGDKDTQKRALDEYVETAWRALCGSNKFGVQSAEPDSFEDTVSYPAYRITVTAYTSL
jgi:hypothetical protein